METTDAGAGRASALFRTSAVAVLLWALSRVVIGTTAVLTQLTTAGDGVLAYPDWPTRLLFNWDSGYFRTIAEQGYDVRDASLYAFFPGYPALSRLLTLPFPAGSPGSSVVVWMAVIAQLGSLVAAVVVWQLVRLDHEPLVAACATALVLLGPYSVFLAASYSESLFLAFAVSAWLLARRGRWWASGLAAAGASFTRVNGAFLVVALVVMYVVECRRETRPALGPRLLGVLVGGVGIASYWVYLFVLTGSPTAWWQAQATGWNRSFHWPWVTLYQTAGRALLASTLDRRIQYSLDLIFAAVLVIAMVWFVRSRRFPELTFVGLTALSLMTSFSYLSVARNTATLFPLAIALASSVSSKVGRRWVIGIGCAGVFLLLFNTHQFTLGLWAD